MLRYSLTSLLAAKGRLLLTAFAIVLGVGVVAGGTFSSGRTPVQHTTAPRKIEANATMAAWCAATSDVAEGLNVAAPATTTRPACLGEKGVVCGGREQTN